MGAECVDDAIRHLFVGLPRQAVYDDRSFSVDRIAQVDQFGQDLSGIACLEQRAAAAPSRALDQEIEVGAQPDADTAFPRSARGFTASMKAPPPVARTIGSPRQQARYDPPLARSKMVLAMAFENLGDRQIRRPLDFCIRISKTAAKLAGKARADRGFSRPHQSDQHDRASDRPCCARFTQASGRLRFCLRAIAFAPAHALVFRRYPDGKAMLLGLVDHQNARGKRSRNAGGRANGDVR